MSKLLQTVNNTKALCQIKCKKETRAQNLVFPLFSSWSKFAYPKEFIGVYAETNAEVWNETRPAAAESYNVCM